MERLARRVALPLIAAFAIVSSAGATSGVSVRFSTVLRESAQPAPRVAAPFLRVVPNATSLSYDGLTGAQKATLDHIDLNRFFLFEVEDWARTSGYRVTIVRVMVQRITRAHRQFCVVARIEGPRPGQAVIDRPTFAAHIVKSLWKPFGNNLPTAAVLRDTHGTFLSKTVYTLHSAPADLYPARPALCRV